jgi:hypothetical protein
MTSRHLTFLFSVLSYWSFGQVLQNGLILQATSNKEDNCCIYCPKSGFTVYKSSGGEAIGKLTRNVSENQGDQAPYRIYFVDMASKLVNKVELENFQEIGYEQWTLKYFERKNGFVRINQKSDYWLSENEIQKLGFEIVEWQTFLSSRSDVGGFYANDPGLNLREGPTTQSKILKTLRGDLFEISPTHEHNGLWTKVKVIKRKEHPCESTLSDKDNIEYELSGWVKIVDDSGTPNVWYNARGC